MISPLGSRAPSRTAIEPPVVPLSQRAGDATNQDDPAALVEDMTRRMAVQQFVEAMLQGEPELTGVPELTLDGDS
jgi:hypothetical protein